MITKDPHMNFFCVFIFDKTVVMNCQKEFDLQGSLQVGQISQAHNFRKKICHIFIRSSLSDWSNYNFVGKSLSGAEVRGTLCWCCSFSFFVYTCTCISKLLFFKCIMFAKNANKNLLLFHQISRVLYIITPLPDLNQHKQILKMLWNYWPA